MRESEIYQAEPLPAPPRPRSMLVIVWLGGMLVIECTLLYIIFLTLTH